MDTQGTVACLGCRRNLRYRFIHNGFNESVYAYCDSCGKLATLDTNNGHVPRLVSQRDRDDWASAIDTSFESELEPCACGGRFCRGAAPRCPYCRRSLTLDDFRDPPSFATRVLCRLGLSRTWLGPRSWTGLYSVVIEDNRVDNNLRPLP